MDPPSGGRARGGRGRAGRGTGRGRGRPSARGTSRREASNTNADGDSESIEATSQPSRTDSALGEHHDGQTSRTITPAPAPPQTGTRAGSQATGESTTKPARGTSVARFRPKNIRRDEAAREILARQELQKLQTAQAAEEARLRTRSRGRGRRVRGDGAFRGGLVRSAVASGPFSQIHIPDGPGRSSHRSSGFGSGSGSGSGYSFSKGKTSGAKFESKSKSSREFGEAGNYNDREPRLNADRFVQFPLDRELDSEDETTQAIIQAKSDGVYPMGISRKVHKDQGLVVASTAELEAEEHTAGDDDMWVDGAAWSRPIQVAEDNKVWHAAPKGPGAIHVKSEPGLDVEPVDFEAGPLPLVVAEPDNKVPTSSAEIKVKRRAVDPEVEMIATDLQHMLTDLGTIAPEDGSATSEIRRALDKTGHLHLFQFPPLLPPLHPTSLAKVKEEPDDVVMLERPADGAVDLTATEGSNEVVKEVVGDLDPAHLASQLLSQGGLVGKLNVRKSGKVELDWGGKILDMSPAVGMNFLTTAVIVEEGDEKPKLGVVSGESIGMGKIMGRYVLAPVWGDEDDWVVDPADLNP